MNFSLPLLREKVSGYMSEKRFSHTLGVEKMARKLGEYLLPSALDELSAGALLHDVAKEISKEEQLYLIEALGFSERDLTLETPACLHAFAAPMLIKRDFPEYATENILSATFKHTTGYSEMSIFDKIIFISDYIEESRTYPPCIKIREHLIAKLEEKGRGRSPEFYLNKAILEAIDNTLYSLTLRGSKISDFTLMAKKAISSLI